MTGNFKKPQVIGLNRFRCTLNWPAIMGILNVTPDSFYDGGRYNDTGFALKKVRQMVDEGADIIDVGAMSSRPGAKEIDQNTEIERLKPVLDRIRIDFPDLCISLDTYRASVALWAIEHFNINMINDISGGLFDPDMFDLVAGKGIPYVMMHMQGTPGNMQRNPHYQDITNEIASFFAHQLNILADKSFYEVILDPGFGFGKTLDHNYELLARLDEFKIFNNRLLVGLSRKSMIFKLIGGAPEQALNGTTALHMLALQKGADLLRVHDVKAAKECINFYKEVSKY